MVHRYIADTLVTLSQPTVDRYLDRRFTDDRPMHIMTDTRPLPGRYINRQSTAISIDTPK